MKEHMNVLELAAQRGLPDNIDEESSIPVMVVQELVDAGYLKAIDASSMSGVTYLNPKITLAGREYLDHLKNTMNGNQIEPNTQQTDSIDLNASASDIWIEIGREYDVTKRLLGKRINFVKDGFKRKIIFRDIEQAFQLAKFGFNKPSVVLAGGIIEELLRLYLENKGITPQRNNLDSYIKACEDNGLLKTAIYKLADSIRQFRNIVHLERESSSRNSISKSAAKGAVSSIFTIANDFDTLQNK